MFRDKLKIFKELINNGIISFLILICFVILLLIAFFVTGFMMMIAGVAIVVIVLEAINLTFNYFQKKM